MSSSALIMDEKSDQVRSFINADRVCQITQEKVSKGSGVIIKSQEGQKNWIFDRDSLIQWFKTTRKDGEPINPATNLPVSSENIIDEKTNLILDESEYEVEGIVIANTFTAEDLNNLLGITEAQRNVILQSDYVRWLLNNSETIDNRSALDSLDLFGDHTFLEEV